MSELDPFMRPKDGDSIIEDYEQGRFVRLDEVLMIEAEEVEKAKRAFEAGPNSSVAYLLGEDETQN